GVQRHPAGKRHRQLHQDRAARGGAHRARRRRCPPRGAQAGPVDDGPRRYARGCPGWEVTAMPASAAWLKSRLPFVVMCFGGFMALLDIQIVASSLQYIGGGLSAARDEISWVLTAYLIAEIVIIPMSGWLTRVSFTVLSALCALAWSIE